MKTKISEPVEDWQKELEEEIEKDVFSFEYVYFLGKLLEKEIPDSFSLTFSLNYKYINKEIKIAEHLVDKNKLNEIKKSARNKALEDFKIIYRTF